MKGRDPCAARIAKRTSAAPIAWVVFGAGHALLSVCLKLENRALGNLLCGRVIPKPESQRCREDVIRARRIGCPKYRDYYGRGRCGNHTLAWQPEAPRLYGMGSLNGFSCHF